MIILATAATALLSEGQRGEAPGHPAAHDADAPGQLVTAHLGLARYLARRFTNQGEPFEDLVQVASLGLVKAAERFDPCLGIPFAAYASHTMVGELKRHLRDRGWALRPPRSIQDRYLAVQRATSRLSQEHGRSPTIAELAAEVGLDDEEVLTALESGRAYRTSSLDAPTSTGDDTEELTLADRLGEEDARFQLAESWSSVAPVVRALPERERVILGLRFFQDLSQSEIAARLGISQMHVSRLLARSLALVRARAGAAPTT
ncbi:MAG TPA: SigB/SigF/SigG family RNA polymerase sigma factor [Acidimicrobiales bacterium]|nr:SigB/SigF/SigG family RNA polymerase sigma factor [Acidimicrobiales bacterium]